MTKVIQITYSDFLKMVDKAAGKEPKVIGVTKKVALRETGLTYNQLIEEVKKNPAIRIRANRYNINLLKTA